MRYLHPKVFVITIACCILVHGSVYSQASAKTSPQPSAKARIDRINNSYLKSFDTLNRAVSAAFTFWVRPGNDDTLSEKIGDHLYKLNKLLVTINASKDFTIRVTNADCKEQLSEEFDNYTALINRSVKLRNKDSAAIAYNFIRTDLIVKMRRKDGLSGNMGLVSIKVSVLDTAGEELPGYKVFARPLLSVTKRSVQEYTPTPNAIKAILPGFKVIWVENNGVVVFKRTEEIKWKETPTIYDFTVEGKP